LNTDANSRVVVVADGLTPLEPTYQPPPPPPNAPQQPAAPPGAQDRGTVIIMIIMHNPIYRVANKSKTLPN